MRPADKLRLAALGAGALLLALIPQVGIRAARQGLMIWMGALIPALFPYCFLAIALQRGGLGRLLGGRLGGLARALGCPADGAGAWICGWLGGNPTGAALTAICAEQGGSRAELTRLAWLSSACSPAFALGALEQALPGGGWTLLTSSWLGILISAPLLKLITSRGAIARRLSGEQSACAGPPRPSERAQCKACALSPALEAARATLLVGCFVVLFSVLSAYMYLGIMLLAPKVKPLAPACLHAILEMAGGCLALAELPGAQILPLVCFAITFGGLSIGMQALALLRPAGIPGGLYLAGKAFQGALAALICAAFTRAGAVEAFARAGDALGAPPAAPIALAALALAIAATLLNRRYIAWDKRNLSGGQAGRPPA